MTVDSEKAAHALEMIRTELGGRPTVNTLRTFLLLAEYQSGGLGDIERVLKLSSGTVARTVKFWIDRNFLVDSSQLRNPRRRRVRISYEGMSFHRRLKEMMESGKIPAPDPIEIDSDDEPDSLETDDPWLKEYFKSDEFKELQRKDAEKRRREEAEHQEWLAKRDERRRNPKSPLDAYRNWLEQCPHPSGSKQRKEWKRTNALLFNGVTYVDHWSPQRSNSGKTTRWHGWLTGSDGSHHEIVDEHTNNRRNDPKRNWGLPE
ncbi:hypothetical protein [Bradyrhizobium sp. WSM1417]|uniref:hypothetical protein n=1 Tax=Bradyrhizobium sp. WSM1417 TaxID=754500 RepID=UPI00047F80F8|nr:hypothetical protein [Bradyrhizobium sp. WSM1417]